MPRRISDYPDAYAGWNLISSIGSIVSVIATYIFIYILYNQLTKGNAIYRDIWSIPKFYNDTLRVYLNRTHGSIEWCLSSPPKTHAFINLPLQS